MSRRATPSSVGAAIDTHPMLTHCPPQYRCTAIDCRRPRWPESSATAAGVGGGWGTVRLAVGDSGMVVRVGPRAGDATNTPAVEAGDAAASADGNHGQCTAATGRAAGISWRRRRLAGHSIRRGRIRCQCACPRTNDGRTASDHQDEQARACAQRDLRLADIPHNREV
jgi:hypothetical protein